MNNMRPAAGAFTTQGMEPSGSPPMAAPAPQMAPGPVAGRAPDASALMAKLASLGLLGGSGGGGLTGPAQAAPAMAPRPALGSAPVAGASSDPFMELEGLLGKMPPVSEMPTRPSRKSVFKPGKPGQPKSGMRAHEILNNPDMVATLQERLSTWEAENPNKKLMGSHIQQMLPEVSAAQARTIKRLLDKALNKSAAVDMDSLIQRGAATALKKGP